MKKIEIIKYKYAEKKSIDIFEDIFRMVSKGN